MLAGLEKLMTSIDKSDFKCILCGELFSNSNDYAEHKTNVCLDSEEVFSYLDILRESGATNMFGAGSYIVSEFGCSKELARKALSKWMESFESRHPDRSETKPEASIQDELDELVKEFKAKHPNSKIVAKLIEAEPEPKGRGIIKGYKPNRISFYILCLSTGRLADLENALWKDMEKYKV